MSKKRRGQMAERAALRERVIARDGGRCKAQQHFPNLMCVGPLDVHEIIPRSAWPDGWLVDDNCVSCCRNHHSFIDNNPELARAAGLHGSSWDRPDGHCGNGVAS